MGKKLLIICYSFPPYPGIGGRRWAKFAKYFAANGVECHVINACNYDKKNSLWTKDVENHNIIIHPLKFKFQYWMGYYSNSILYRFGGKLLRTLINQTKYSPYFPTSHSRKQLQKKCIELIKKHDVTTVMASGDPYMQYYVAELKEKCNVKVLLDYRDTWNDRPYYSQNKFHKLTNKQRAFFEFSEKESLKKCDEVVCVYEPMIQLLSTRSGKSKEHFYVIPNGFDKEDYPSIKQEKHRSKVTTLYFGGSIPPGDRTDYFIQFLKAYSQLRYSNNNLWSQFCININGDGPIFEEELKKINDHNINFEKGFISSQQYMEKLGDSDYGIISNPDEYVDSFFITKTYDYLYMEKPILYLGKKGKVSKFIEENGIGVAFNPNEKTEVFFQKLLSIPSDFSYPKEVHDKIQGEYDVKNLSLKYLNLLRLGK